ncbi:MAG: acetylxylan esterase [Bacillota bacterium]|nr:acetylxylan esterase [Bacillota bacterium]
MSGYNLLNEMLLQRNLPELWPDAPTFPTAADWERRRQAIVDILSRHVYGRMPGHPAEVSAKVLSEDRHAFAGKAVQQTIELTMDLPNGRFSFPLQYLLPIKPRSADPADWSGFPFFVHIAFRPDVPDKYLPAEEIIDEGFALFNFCYQDITPDQDDQFVAGLPASFPLLQDQPDRWGKIAMWAWAASRVMDYANQAVLAGAPLDLQKAAVIGHSRLGKTALWAGANDTRFQFVISNDSGCAGAALERGKSGEDVKAITDRFPYWFCPAYLQYANAPDSMPFDQHFLLAASAPRHVYVASAAEDAWADPDAEFLSAFAAGAVYRQLGLLGLLTDRLPDDNCRLTEGHIAYHRRPGTHYLSRMDWQRFMDYISRMP